MEFFKEWIGGITAAIIFASLCEILLPSGNMKKYVNLILGIILSIMMINPLADLKFNNWSDDLFAFERSNAFATQAKLEEEERKTVIKIYNNKLTEAIEKQIYEKVKAEFTVNLDIETENPENFGEIKNVTVTVIQNDGFIDYRETIENILKTEFGVAAEKVKIKFKSN